MIIKSYEIKKNKFNLLKNNFYLLYGENLGLKKDIKNYVIGEIKKEYKSLEIISLYENEILENEKDLKQSRDLLDESAELLEKLNSDKILSDKLKNDLSNQKNRLNQKINNLSIKVQSQELKFESLKASQDAMKTAINRLEAQRTQLKSRSLEITLKNKKENQPEDDSKRKLESLLNKSLDKEKD